MINVKIWESARCARITDMTNAGKRGKTCRLLRFRGSSAMPWPNPVSHAACDATDEILGRLGGLPESASFDDVAALLHNAVAVARAAGVSADLVAVFDDETVRGVDAPKPKLTAGNEKWSGYIDEDGVHLEDLSDKNNLPHERTHGQAPDKAYKLAKKVWHLVERAETMGAAAKILREAGCALHGWCAMD